MKNLNWKIFIIPFLILILFSCKKEKEIITETIIDEYIFEVNSEPVYQTSAEKTKQKSTEQYISILYSNLFQNSINQSDLTDLSLLKRAFGDKQAADELIINSFINNPAVIIPTDQQMRNNPDDFITDTYIRFFLRIPTAYEVYELKQEIESDTELTTKEIYTSFAISNEYKFY